MADVVKPIQEVIFVHMRPYASQRLNTTTAHSIFQVGVCFLCSNKVPDNILTIFLNDDGDKRLI